MSTTASTTTTTSATESTTIVLATPAPTPRATATTTINKLYLSALIDFRRPLSFAIFYTLIYELGRGLAPFLFIFNVLAHVLNCTLLALIAQAARAFKLKTPRALTFNPDPAYAFFPIYARYLPTPKSPRDIAFLFRDIGACLRAIAFLAVLVVRFPIVRLIAFVTPKRFTTTTRRTITGIPQTNLDAFAVAIEEDHTRLADEEKAAAAARYLAAQRKKSKLELALPAPLAGPFDKLLTKKPMSARKRHHLRKKAARAAELARIQAESGEPIKAPTRCDKVKAALNVKAKVADKWEEWNAVGLEWEHYTGRKEERYIFHGISRVEYMKKHGIKTNIWSAAYDIDETHHLEPFYRARARIGLAKESIRGLKAEGAPKLAIKYVEWELEKQASNLRYEMKCDFNNHYFWRLGGLDKSQRPNFAKYVVTAVGIRWYVRRTVWKA